MGYLKSIAKSVHTKEVKADTRQQFALIGAGPMGLAMAKTLREKNIEFQGFELAENVGGLWDIDAPQSTMYDSAHLISSKTMTEFSDFPMEANVAEYPSHHEMKKYFQAFAERFDLYRNFHFGAQVLAVSPLGDDGEGWLMRWKDREGQEIEAEFAGILIANGTLAEPNEPKFRGEFTGELIHSSSYRDPEQFRNKRVLIVGAGNSGCDIAVDAIHHGKRCDISMRRGYHFVPKYVFGLPADTIGGKIRLPMWLKRRIDSVILRWFVGHPEKYGFPIPDHALYESHPVINSLILFHAGHGDLKVRPDIDRFDGKSVWFKDGSKEEYDLILAATGYKLHYPFIDNQLLNWQGSAPHLYLNCIHPERDDLFVLGMVEAAGLGWQGRHEQAEMVARYINGIRRNSGPARRLKAKKSGTYRRATGGMNYMDIPRMAYYVDKTTYRNAVCKHIRDLKRGVA